MDTDTALFWLKLVHTLITLTNTAALAYILYCGLTGRFGTWLNVALVLIALEVAALVAFGLNCPLQLWARALEGVDGPTDDLFLPDWMATNIVQVSMPFALVGIGLVLRNHLARRQLASAQQSRKRGPDTPS